jgi:hypothetical protein
VLTKILVPCLTNPFSSLLSSPLLSSPSSPSSPLPLHPLLSLFTLSSPSSPSPLLTLSSPHPLSSERKKETRSSNQKLQLYDNPTHLTLFTYMKLLIRAGYLSLSGFKKAESKLKIDYVVEEAFTVAITEYLIPKYPVSGMST